MDTLIMSALGLIIFGFAALGDLLSGQGLSKHPIETKISFVAAIVCLSIAAYI